ncbi:MAG: glycosyltransferase family 1 protein, partial [Candidatus Paceibacteria bacterium]
VPVIVADTPSLTEVAGEAGLICDPHDPHSIKTEMERLWNDADLRHQLSTQALERANMFSWNRCAQETLEVLTRIYEQST